MSAWGDIHESLCRHVHVNDRLVRIDLGGRATRGRAVLSASFSWVTIGGKTRGKGCERVRGTVGETHLDSGRVTLGPWYLRRPDGWGCPGLVVLERARVRLHDLETERARLEPFGTLVDERATRVEPEGIDVSASKVSAHTVEPTPPAENWHTLMQTDVSVPSTVVSE